MDQADSNSQYRNYLQNRGVNNITFYGRMTLNSLDCSDKSFLSERIHIFKTGDRLYKLSHQYYGDPIYWWVIAWYNHTPTDFHCSLGDELFIPFPLEDAIYLATKGS